LGEEGIDPSTLMAGGRRRKGKIQKQFGFNGDDDDVGLIPSK